MMSNKRRMENYIRVYDPTRTSNLVEVVLPPIEYTYKELKIIKLKSLIDKYENIYSNFVMYALLALIGVLVNTLLQGVSLLFMYPILIVYYLAIPVIVFIIGISFLLYSKILKIKLEKYKRSNE